MVHTAIIAFILILIMFSFTDTEIKKHNEETSNSTDEVSLNTRIVNEADILLNVKEVSGQDKSIKEKELKVKEEVEKATSELPVEGNTVISNKTIVPQLIKVPEQDNTLNTTNYSTGIVTVLEKEILIPKHMDEKIQNLLGKNRELTGDLLAALEDKKEVENKNIDLEGRIAKLLAIAKDASLKIKIEYDKDQTELQQLLVDKKIVEDSLKLQSTDNKVLKAKIEELLSIAEKGTKKAEIEFTSLLLQKEELINNLEVRSKNEKELEVENSNIVNLLLLAKESSVKSKGEIEEQRKKLESLMIQKDKLASEKLHLQGKIDELLDIAQKGTQRAQVVFNAMVSQEKALERENVTLKATIKEINKANTEIEQLKEEKSFLEESMKKAVIEAKEKAKKVATDLK